MDTKKSFIHEDMTEFGKAVAKWYSGGLSEENNQIREVRGTIISPTLFACVVYYQNDHVLVIGPTHIVPNTCLPVVEHYIDGKCVGTDVTPRHIVSNFDLSKAFKYAESLPDDKEDNV